MAAALTSHTIHSSFRQERLEQLARKFERKAKLRDTWLREMMAVLQDFDFGKTASQVEASVKKHEAISADILPRVSVIWEICGKGDAFDCRRIDSGTSR